MGCIEFGVELSPGAILSLLLTEIALPPEALDRGELEARAPNAAERVRAGNLPLPRPSR